MARRLTRSALRAASPSLAALVPLGFRLLGPGNPFLTPYNAPKLFGRALDIDLPPERIEEKLKLGRPPHWPLRFISGGNWDLAAGPEMIRAARDFMADLLAHQADPTGSRVYRDMMERIEAGRPLVKAGILVGDAEVALRHCLDYIATAENMRAQGYRADLAPDAIEIALGRDGQPLHLRQGNHRLAFAQILGLPRVTVRVRFVHLDFAQSCLAREPSQPLLALRRGLDAVSRAAIR